MSCVKTVWYNVWSKNTEWLQLSLSLMMQFLLVSSSAWCDCFASLSYLPPPFPPCVSSPSLFLYLQLPFLLPVLLLYFLLLLFFFSSFFLIYPPLPSLLPFLFSFFSFFLLPSSSSPPPPLESNSTNRNKHYFYKIICPEIFPTFLMSWQWQVDDWPPSKLYPLAPSGSGGSRS